MRVTPTLRWLIIGVLALCLTLDPGAVSLGNPQDRHPWGRFQPGAWKLVRIQTKTFGDEMIISTTNAKTTLNEVGEQDVSLLVQTSVEVAGKQFDSKPQKIQQDFHGEAHGENVVTVDIGTTELDIQGRKIPCEIEQLESNGPNGKTTTRIYCSDTVTPHILKKQRKTIAPDGEVVDETTVDVIALDIPCKVRNEIYAGAHLKVTHKYPQGETTIRAIVCDDVPGGIVCHSLTELDASGHQIRQSSLELLDYGLEEDQEDRGGFFHRRKIRMNRKTLH